MKISAGTVARTICMAVALLNQILVLFGKNVIPFAEDDIYRFVSMAFMAAATLAAWWKNNSFTKEAIYADLILREERRAKSEIVNK